MSELLAQDPVRKTVVGTDGTIFGTLYTITMDHESGALCELVVEPHERLPPRAVMSKTDDGRLLVPVSLVRTVTDRDGGSPNGPRNGAMPVARSVQVSQIRPTHLASRR